MEGRAEVAACIEEAELRGLDLPFSPLCRPVQAAPGVFRWSRVSSVAMRPLTGASSAVRAAALLLLLLVPGSRE